ncbi:MAG: endopeptidase La [Oscillospiraceae bacterium]|nr:endopeptidase La [Oscillospiraceae bacterium]
MNQTTEMQTEPIFNLPMIALRGLVIFPNSSVQFDVGRKKSMLAVNAALEHGQKIFLVAQKDLSDDDPGQDKMYSTGVVATVKQVFRQSDNGLRLLVEGLQRATLCEITQQRPFLRADVVLREEIPSTKTPRSEALIRRMQNLFEHYIQNFRQVPPDIVVNVVKQKDCGRLADFIAANVALDYEDKQEILEEKDPVKRLQTLINILEEEIRVLEIENEIAAKAKEQIDLSQREYYLREQMRAIAEELGDEETPLEEADAFRAKVAELALPEVQTQKLLKEIDKLSKMPQSSHEYSVQRNYIETCLELPWNVSDDDTIHLDKAQKILDKDHYGLEKVKERIVESLAVRKLAGDNAANIICLVGPPGVGKTSIAKSVARATGRKYVRISLGGVRDESEIVGHRKTYVGSMPGRIIAALKQAGTNNPLILLDEIDKLCSDFRGDPASALLEVLDSEQNSAFQDHYIDMPFDLSHVMFLTTANDASTIPAPLYDRMDVINLYSYTREEKFQIATKHLVPKQLKKHGLTAKQLKITPKAIREIIDGYTKEAGVRTLERTIASLCRKAAKAVVEDENAKLTINKSNLETYLGPRKFRGEELVKTDEVGLVNGLAWTSVGGEMLPIEVAVMEGSGKIELTGNLGDVMKESAKAAITCVRTRAEGLGIPTDFHSKMDIHIHVPEGAIPKDGPSAGIAMGTAITSALTEIPIRHDVAMTGEITLQGRVLPIGGLKEKSMAAYRAGIKDVIIPKDNEPDLSEIESVVKEAVRFHPVQRIDEVLEIALCKKPKPLPKRKTGEPDPSVLVPSKQGDGKAISQ